MKHVTRLQGLNVLLCLGVFTFLCPGTWAQSRADVLTQIRLQQQHYAQTLLSVSSHITLTTDYTPLRLFYLGSSTGPQPLHTQSVVDWASKADNMLDTEKTYDREVLTYPKGQSRVVTNIWDGKNNYFLVRSDPEKSTYGTSGASLGRGTDWNPLDLGYRYHSRPLSEWISSPNAAVEGVVKDPKFGLLWIVRTPFKRGSQTGTYRFWFAPKYQMMAVKSEETDQIASNGTSQWSAVVEQVTRHGDLWLADTAVVSHFISTDVRGSLESTERLRFENTKINNAPDALFKPHVPVGSHVDDLDTHRRYTLTASGQWIRIASPFDMKPTPNKQIAAVEVNPFALLFCISAVATTVLIVIRQRTQRRPTS